ncbi:MAG: hypothetical protein WBD84_05420, partial [Methyloceanibacter sp.]
RSGADGAAGFSSAKRGSGVAESARGMNNDARRSPDESARQTLHCAPYCTPPLVIGNTPDIFGTVAGQIRGSQRSGSPAQVRR